LAAFWTSAQKIALVWEMHQRAKDKRLGEIYQDVQSPLIKGMGLQHGSFLTKWIDILIRVIPLRDAIEDLEESAGLLLCNEYHNSQRKRQSPVLSGQEDEEQMGSRN
jgi:hypothetical protein